MKLLFWPFGTWQHGGGVCRAPHHSLFLFVAQTAVWNVNANNTNKTHVVGGQNLLLSCGIAFHSPSWRTPEIKWKLNGWEIAVLQRTTYADSVTLFPGMRMKISAINITVPSTADYLPNYACFIRYDERFYRPVSSYSWYTIPFDAEYNWTAPRVKVSCKYNSIITTVVTCRHAHQLLL